MALRQSLAAAARLLKASVRTRSEQELAQLTSTRASRLLDVVTKGGPQPEDELAGVLEDLATSCFSEQQQNELADATIGRACANASGATPQKNVAFLWKGILHADLHGFPPLLDRCKLGRAP